MDGLEKLVYVSSNVCEVHIPETWDNKKPGDLYGDNRTASHSALPGYDTNRVQENKNRLQRGLKDRL